MANLKGTIEFPQGGSSWKTIQGKIEWEETQIDSTSSPVRSKVHTKLYAKTGTGGTTGKQWSGYVQVGSNSKHSFSSISSSTTISSTYVLLKEYDDWVTHNDDGSKTVTISGKVQGPSGTSIANVSSTGSGTVTLTNVPQASTITSVTSGTTDYAPSVVWTPASTSFKYKLIFSYGNWSVATGILSPGTTSAYTYNGYTITGANVASYMGSASGTFTVTLYTYASDGTTQIGNTSSKTFTVTLNASYKPTASVGTFTDVGGLVPSNWGIFVQSKSKLSFTVSATPSTGSTISSYSTTINGSTYSTTSITTGFLTGNGSANLTVTDSRGRTGTASRSYTVYPYSKPSITNATADRCLQDGTLSDTGTYLKYSFASTISSCNGNNTATYELGYRVKGSNSTYTYVTISNNATNVVLSGVTFNSNSSYDLQFRVTDAFNEVVWENESIGTGFKLVHYNKNKKAIAIGKTSEATGDNKLLEVAMPIETEGLVKIKNQGNTLTIGDQNNAYMHFMNSENKSFYFNRNISVNGNVYGGTSYNRQLAFKDETPYVHYEGTGKDLNNYKTAGMYGFYDYCSNKPAGIYTTVGILMVIPYTTDWLVQLWFEPQAKPIIWQRSWYGANTWGSWYRITAPASVTLDNEWIMGYKANGDVFCVTIPFNNPTKAGVTVNITSAEFYEAGWQTLTYTGRTIMETFVKLSFSTTATTTNGKVYLVRIKGTLSI